MSSNTGLGIMFAKEQDGQEIKKSKLLLRLQDMVIEAYEARKDIWERWKKNEMLYVANPPKQADTRSDVKHAIALAVIQDELPQLRDNMPVIDAVGEGQNDAFFADIINRRIKQLLANAHFEEAEEHVIQNGHIYSIGVMEALPLLRNGKKGETLDGLDLNVYDTMGLFVDPMGDGWDISKKSRYVILADMIPVKAIEAQYDIEPGRIKGGGFDPTEYKSFVSPKSFTEDCNSMLNEIEKIKQHYSIVFKIYWNCIDSLESDTPEEDKFDTEENLIKKYPNGRYTVICCNQILEDSALELPRVPIFGYKNYSIANVPYGIAETQLVAPGNFMSNFLTSNMADNVTDFGNPKRKIKRSLFRKAPNQIATSRNIEVDDTNDITYLQAQSIPSSTFNTLQYSRDLMNHVTGVQDIVQGKTPTGIQSGIAIRALYEASQGRIRHKIDKDIKPELERFGEYVAWLIQTYDAEVVNIRGELTNTGDYAYHKLDPEAKYIFSDNKYTPLKGDITPDQDNVVTLKDTKVNIRIEPGRGGAKGRAARSLENLEMMNAGLIPYYRWVADTDLPDKAELIKWHDTNNTTKQMMLQLQEVALALFGQKKVADISVQDTEQQLEGLLKQIAKLDLDIL